MQAFDEMGDPGEDGRSQYALVREWLSRAPHELLAHKIKEAELLFRRVGITFAVYTEGGDPERLIPFDIVPRVLDGDEWGHLERGLEQRVKALNAFLRDVYHEREIIKAGHVPASLIDRNEGFLEVMRGVEVPGNIYTHVAGIDMVRVGPEEFYVLEDNCRTPSGVSYMLENREVDRKSVV